MLEKSFNLLKKCLETFNLLDSICKQKKTKIKSQAAVGKSIKSTALMMAIIMTTAKVCKKKNHHDMYFVQKLFYAN